MTTDAGAKKQTTGRRGSARARASRASTNRFSNLAGGSETAEVYDSPADDPLSGGLLAGLSSQGRQVRTVEGHAVVDLPVAKMVPHPWNDEARSQPQPDNPKWEELVNGVAANGVKIPGLVVTRDAFIAQRPQLKNLLGDAEYVIIYGHRRWAASKATGRATMPGVIDDAALADDGDMDAMALENLGREDLSELAEAHLFARYSEDRGFTQRQIADKLGVHQTTISRRLSLLLLCPEALEAYEGRKLGSADAAALSGALPHGPIRKWQIATGPEQNTDERLSDQVAALRLIIDHSVMPTRAAERVKAERKSREQAAADDLQLIDPSEQFGSAQVKHRLFDAETIKAARTSGHLVAAILPDQGTLAYYTSKPVETSGSDSDTGADDGLQRKLAATTRRACCSQLCRTTPAKDVVVDVLVAHKLTGQDSRSPDVWKLAHQWSVGADGDGPATPELFRAHISELTDSRARLHAAWTLTLAQFEIATAAATEWGPTEALYLKILTSRAEYVPTPWEEEQLHQAATTAQHVPDLR